MSLKKGNFEHGSVNQNKTIKRSTNFTNRNKFNEIFFNSIIFSPKIVSAQLLLPPVAAASVFHSQFFPRLHPIFGKMSSSVHSKLQLFDLDPIFQEEVCWSIPKISNVTLRKTLFYLISYLFRARIFKSKFCYAKIGKCVVFPCMVWRSAGAHHFPRQNIIQSESQTPLVH